MEPARQPGGAAEVSVGIIAKHVELREWYRRLGFVESGSKAFSHLPFEVAYLCYDLRASKGEGPQ